MTWLIAIQIQGLPVTEHRNVLHMIWQQHLALSTLDLIHGKHSTFLSSLAFDKTRTQTRPDNVCDNLSFGCMISLMHLHFLIKCNVTFFFFYI